MKFEYGNANVLLYDMFEDMNVLPSDLEYPVAVHLPKTAAAFIHRYLTCGHWQCDLFLLNYLIIEHMVDVPS